MKYKLNRFFSTNENQWKEYIGEYGYSLGEMKKVNSWKCVPDYALCVVQGSIYYQNVTRDIQHAIVVRRQNGLISILDPSLDKIKYDFWNYHLTLKECYEIIKKPFQGFFLYLINVSDKLINFLTFDFSCQPIIRAFIIIMVSTVFSLTKFISFFSFS